MPNESNTGFWNFMRKFFTALAITMIVSLTVAAILWFSVGFDFRLGWGTMLLIFSLIIPFFLGVAYVPKLPRNLAVIAMLVIAVFAVLPGIKYMMTVQGPYSTKGYTKWRISQDLAVGEKLTPESLSNREVLFKRKEEMDLELAKEFNRQIGLVFTDTKTWPLVCTTGHAASCKTQADEIARLTQEYNREIEKRARILIPEPNPYADSEKADGIGLTLPRMEGMPSMFWAFGIPLAAMMVVMMFWGKMPNKMTKLVAVLAVAGLAYIFAGSQISAMANVQLAPPLPVVQHNPDGSVDVTLPAKYGGWVPLGELGYEDVVLEATTDTINYGYTSSVAGNRAHKADDTTFYPGGYFGEVVALAGDEIVTLRWEREGEKWIGRLPLEDSHEEVSLRIIDSNYEDNRWAYHVKVRKQ